MTEHTGKWRNISQNMLKIRSPQRKREKNVTYIFDDIAKRFFTTYHNSLRREENSGKTDASHVINQGLKPSATEHSHEEAKRNGFLVYGLFKISKYIPRM